MSEFIFSSCPPHPALSPLGVERGIGKDASLVSVVLPTFNEAGNIVPLVEEIHTVLPSPHEVIVVDDNSPDGTSRLVRELIDRGNASWLRLETRLSDRGLTKSLWHGIERARGQVIVWMDCDFSMPPRKIPELLAKVSAGFDIAVGSRFVPGGSAKQGTLGAAGESFLATLLSKVLNLFLRLALTPRFRDYTSGFVAVRRRVFSRLRLTGDYGEYFMDFIVRSMLAGFTVVEVPYVNELRRAGESKTAPTFPVLLRRGLKYLGMILRLEWLKLKHLLGATIEDRDALPS